MPRFIIDFEFAEQPSESYTENFLADASEILRQAFLTLCDTDDATVPESVMVGVVPERKARRERPDWDKVQADLRAGVYGPWEQLRAWASMTMSAEHPDDGISSSDLNHWLYGKVESDELKNVAAYYRSQCARYRRERGAEYPWPLIDEAAIEDVCKYLGTDRQGARKAIQNARTP